jgi:uncharacterized protein (TIGR01777 family)
MKIIVAGSSGFVGTALTAFLEARGGEIFRLTRSPLSKNDKNLIPWDPMQGQLSAPSLEGCDVVINLAGENIANGRWTKRKKMEIRDSRVQSTQLLSRTLASLKQPPQVLINASAIGYYGTSREEPVTEESSKGIGFLADVCEAWENATFDAENRGIRVVRLRLGVVLDSGGGVLKRMLFPFKCGLGGILGTGKQEMSWISLEDLCGVVHQCIIDTHLQGPVNAVTENVVTNREFTKTLGKILKRPTVFPVPAFVLKLLLGEMADELLLSSLHVVPKKLLERNYPFELPELEMALAKMLAH